MRWKILNAVWLLTNSQTASNNGIAAGHKKIVVGKTFETRIGFAVNDYYDFLFPFFKASIFSYYKKK